MGFVRYEIIATVTGRSGFCCDYINVEMLQKISYKMLL